VNLSRAWLLVLALLSSTSGHAGLRLSLDSDALSHRERQASQLLLSEALAALPALFKQRLDRRIKVRWRTMPAEVYGRAGRFSGIELNSQLLPSLSDGSAATTPTRRPHGTVRSELLATVLHELTHLYDRAQLWPQDEKRLLQSCRLRLASLGPIGLPDACRGQTARRFTLSDDPRLLDLAGWPQQVGRRGARELANGQVARSPDAYELSNPREFVAVNLEYFLLDPSYACRRPSLARHFSEHFAGWTPPHRQPCSDGYAYLNAGRDFARQPLGTLDAPEFTTRSKDEIGILVESFARMRRSVVQAMKMLDS
jgi:HAMP domain-containing protein